MRRKYTFRKRRGSEQHSTAALLYGTLLAFALATAVSCQKDMKTTGDRSSGRDINQVLAHHSERLMALPSVTGVYVGLLPDGKNPCITVMLVEDSAKIRKALPKELEGYPVVAEVTGPITPFKNR